MVIERELPQAQPGPQTQLVDCEADIAIYGGAAGGGKSYGALLCAGQYTQVEGVKAFRAVFFRRTEPQLRDSGGLWDKSQEPYRALGGRPRTAELDWTFEASSGRIEDRHRIEFRHMQRETDCYDHDGHDYALVVFDELQHFTSTQFWYLRSRLRSTSGVRPHLRATCNPDPDSFVADLIEWWIGPDGYPIPERSGVIRWFVRDEETDALDWFDSREEALEEHPERTPISLTFIAAKLSDNQELLRQDPTYRATLESMSKHDRLRLLGERDAKGRDRGGNWRIRAGAGTFFPRAKLVKARRPPSDVVRSVRFWDRAYTEPTPKKPNPDWTRGVRVSLCQDGEYWIDSLISMRARVATVSRAMRATAETDGIEVTAGTFVESGFAGKTDRETISSLLEGYEVELVEGGQVDVSKEGVHGSRSSRAKMALARAWTKRVEDGLVYVLDADWTEEMLRELDAFPHARFDDIVDAISGAMHVLGSERASDLAEAMSKVRIWRTS